MRLLPLAVVATLLTTLTLEAGPGRTLTRPEVPRAETLQRLGLKKRWHIYTPVSGRRDSLTHVLPLDRQLVLLTESGILIALDAESGSLRWQLRLGEAYRGHTQFVTANNRTLFVVSGTKLYGIDRDAGTTDYTVDLPGTLAAAPAVDDYRMLLCTSRGWVYNYALPPPPRRVAFVAGQRAGSAPAGQPLAQYTIPPPETSAALTTIKEPLVLWNYQSDAPLSQPPVVTSFFAVVPDDNGSLRSFDIEKRTLVDRFHGISPLAAPVGQFGTSLYLPTRDYHVYAFDVDIGRLDLRWQYTAGGRVLHKPAVIGPELYVAALQRGLACLDRHSSEERWVQPTADRFIAATKRLVVAADNVGQLLVLDRPKGRVLGTLDTRAFAFRVPNDVTDRVFLANHDGLVVCMQDLDREADKPTIHNIPTRKPVEGEPVKEDKGPAEKKEEKVDKAPAPKPAEKEEMEGKPPAKKPAGKPAEKEEMEEKPPAKKPAEKEDKP